MSLLSDWRSCLRAPNWNTAHLLGQLTHSRAAGNLSGMKATLDQVTNDASELSPHDRWKLVARLIRDLEPGKHLPDAEVEKAWNEEISRRLEEIDSGKVKPVPAEEVFARIRKRLDEAH